MLLQSSLLIMDLLYNGPPIILDYLFQIPISDNVLHTIMTKSRHNELSKRSQKVHYHFTVCESSQDIPTRLSLDDKEPQMFGFH